MVTTLVLAFIAIAAQAMPVAEKTYGERIRAALAHVAAGELDLARAELDATDLSARGFEWSHAHLALELARSHGAGPGLEALGRGRPAAGPAPVTAVSRLYGHSAACRVLVLAPDGERLASGGDEHEVHLWNARTGAQERKLGGHAGSIVGLSFARDGRTLASASADGNVILWDVLAGEARRTLRATGEALTALAWSADGRSLATADATFAVRFWDPAGTDEPRLAVRGHGQTITALAFSPDGALLASASEDGSVRVVDVTSGETRRRFGGNGVPVRAVAFEPSEPRLRVAVDDGSIRRLDVTSGLRTDASFPVGEVLWSVAVSPDGARIAAGSELGFVYLFDQASKSVFDVRLGLSPVFALAFDPRGTRLFAAGPERVIHVLETDPELARTLQRQSPDALPSDEAALAMRPLEVDARCRRVVERPGLALETYQRAEALARATLGRIPGSGQVSTTVGAALYRQDRFDEALALLAEAGEMRRGYPPNLAFRALALARTGRLDDAQAMLERLRTLLTEARWRTDPDAQALLAEARAVVAAARTPPK